MESHPVTSRRSKLIPSEPPAPPRGLRFGLPRIGLPRFVVRLRLGLLQQSIAHLERQLAGEFASTDTAPLLREHAALVAQRDALLASLAE